MLGNSIEKCPPSYAFRYCAGGEGLEGDSLQILAWPSRYFIRDGEKIKKVAGELGYYPNFIARNLSSQRSNTIGVIVPKIAHSFFASIIESIYDTAFESNYEIILTVSRENAPHSLAAVHARRWPDGVYLPADEGRSIRTEANHFADVAFAA